MMQSLQALAGFAAVLALMAGAAWLLRRTMQAAPGRGALALRAALGVGARERVVLLEVGETWLVVGVAQGRVSLLHSLPRGEMPSAAAAAPAAQASFARILERLRR